MVPFIWLTRITDGDGWSKNWYSSSDSLWFDRWKQVLEVLPDYVQIITCKNSPKNQGKRENPEEIRWRMEKRC